MRPDALIIGGSFAGLSAAIYVARARRRVVIIDAGAPRNRFAAHSHGFFAQDGSNPAAMLATARAQVLAYPTVTLVQDRAVDAVRKDDGFAVTLASGTVLEAARLVLAFGLTDILPDIPGLQARWGATVLHCPYCHGYEFGDRPLGVLHAGPQSLHQAQLVTEWGPVTYYLNGATLDPEAEAQLAARGIAVEPRRIRALRGVGNGLAAAELEDGGMRALEALYVAPASRFSSDLATRLGCAMEPGPFGGEMIQTDAMMATSVAGVFAAGDIRRAAHNVTWAAADGVMAGMALHRSLVF